ncbi:MAG: hypothetical protein QOJ46_1097 [bacterium]|jgi:hypothetical protein
MPAEKPEPEPRAEPRPTRAQQELPPRLIAIAYAIALVCVVAPPAILGAGFAGAVLIRSGRPRPGAGVIATALLCSGLGVLLRN